ncbi:prenylated rab acceptor PRA1 [Pisolithus microcarpus]|nr:prenylated rab acceptor PRA1 [Pisolithus microcarpus]
MLSALQPEFFDFHRISRPADVNQAVSRISYNTRYFSCELYVHHRTLTVSLTSLTSPLLLFSLAFLTGGFAAINKFAPDPVQVGDHVITQKSLYTGLFLWLSSPFMTFFWLVGASSCLILGHACLIEPGIESEYTSIQESV